MKSCPHCGESLEKEEHSYSAHDMDEEMSAKESVLKELMELMSQSMGERVLKAKKPAAVKVEMAVAKPADEEDEDDSIAARLRKKLK